MVMKKVNRLMLSGLLALSVTGGSLAPFVASHASADTGSADVWYCSKHQKPMCQEE